MMSGSNTLKVVIPDEYLHLPGYNVDGTGTGICKFV